MYTLNTYPKCKLIELLITDRKRKKIFRGKISYEYEQVY